MVVFPLIFILFCSWLTPGLTQNPISHTFHLNVTAGQLQTSGFNLQDKIKPYSIIYVSTALQSLNNTAGSTADIAVSVEIGTDPNLIRPRSLTELVPPFTAPGDITSSDTIDPCGKDTLINPPSLVPVKVTVSSNVTFVFGSVNVVIRVATNMVTTVPDSKIVETADANNQFLTILLPSAENVSAIDIILATPGNNLNTIFPQIIAAAGDLCPSSGPVNTPNRIVSDLPTSENFTFQVTSQKVWYLEFVKTTEAMGIVNVSFITLPHVRPPPDEAPNNTGIIVGVTITILIVIAGVAIVVYKRKSAYQNIG
jgi:hypothetical protein